MTIETLNLTSKPNDKVQGMRILNNNLSVSEFINKETSDKKTKYTIGFIPL